MGIRLKVDGKVIPSQEEIEKAKNEYLADKDIPLPKLSEPNDNRSHNPNNWDPKSYEETYPNRPMGVSGKSVNSDFERTMDDDTKEMLWGLINENTELKHQLYFAEHRLEQIRRLLEE